MICPCHVAKSGCLMLEGIPIGFSSIGPGVVLRKFLLDCQHRLHTSTSSTTTTTMSIACLVPSLAPSTQGHLLMPMQSRPPYIPGTLVLQGDEFLPMTTNILCPSMGIHLTSQLRVVRVWLAGSFMGTFALGTHMAQLADRETSSMYDSWRRQGHVLYRPSEDLKNGFRSSGYSSARSNHAQPYLMRVDDFVEHRL